MAENEGSAETDNTGDGDAGNDLEGGAVDNTPTFHDTIQNEELRGNEALANFDSPDSLAEGYVSLLNSQPQVPDSVDAYTMDMPENSNIDEADFNSFRDAAFEAKLTPDQWGMVVKYDQERGEKWAAEDATRVEEAAAELKKDWGEKFEENMAKASDVIKKLGFEDLGNEDFVRANPRFAHFLHTLSTKISEDRLTPGDEHTADNREKGEDGKPLLVFTSMES